jgi:hypothetical protein
MNTHVQAVLMRELRARHSIARWTTGRASTLARLLAIGAFAFAAACGSDSTGGGPTDPPGVSTPVGDYSISTVNGKALPVALVSDPSYTWEVTLGTLAITADGKYSVKTTFRQTIPGKVDLFVDSTGGTWTVNGATLGLVDGADGSTAQATWSGNTLTLPETDGDVTTTFVFSRR